MESLAGNDHLARQDRGIFEIGVRTFDIEIGVGGMDDQIAVLQFNVFIGYRPVGREVLPDIVGPNLLGAVLDPGVATALEGLSVEIAFIVVSAELNPLRKVACVGRSEEQKQERE